MAVNIVADIGRAFFRRRKTGSNGSIVQVTFIHTDLFNFRCQRAQKTDKLFAVAAVFLGCAAVDAARTALVMRPLEKTKLFRTLCEKGDALTAKITADD